MPDPDRSYELLKKIESQYDSVKDMIEVGDYYLGQIEGAHVDPVHWPTEVLVRAVDVLEVMIYIHPDGTKRPISIDQSDEIIDPRDRIGLALYQVKVILFGKIGLRTG